MQAIRFYRLAYTIYKDSLGRNHSWTQTAKNRMHEALDQVFRVQGSGFRLQAMARMHQALDQMSRVSGSRIRVQVKARMHQVLRSVLYFLWVEVSRNKRMLAVSLARRKCCARTLNPEPRTVLFHM